MNVTAVVKTEKELPPPHYRWTINGHSDSGASFSVGEADAASIAASARYWPTPNVIVKGLNGGFANYNRIVDGGPDTRIYGPST